MKISIIGSGWVGTAVGRGMAELGNEIIFHDIIDKDLPNFTKDLDYAIENSSVTFVCVPTPTNDEGEIDLSYVEEAAEDIGAALANKNSYHLVVVKSTVVPQTTEKVVIAILEKYSKKKAGAEFGVCMNPEFITEISGTWNKNSDTKKDFFTEDRIVIGEHNTKAGDVLEALYKPLNTPIFRTDLKTAELIKYASNCILAMKVSYWNEIYLLCNHLDINSNEVANIVAQDPRIGKYGSVHGKAFGGKCLPKDLKAFIFFAKRKCNIRLLKAVDAINEELKANYGVRE